MKKTAFILASLALITSGCATSGGASATNNKHPGPAVGQAVGTAAGVVAGNVAGAVVGVAEGAANGVKAPFKNETHVVRQWREVKTSDGRTIKVPVDIKVDSNGNPIE